MSLARVQKRDGREVPFDATKISAAIAKAMRAVGEEDPQFAGEVAGVVALTLESRFAGAPPDAVPGIEDIQDLVEQALVELGRASVAKAYILYRDRRARIREALAVHSDDKQSAKRASVPQVQESDSTSPWSKGRIVAALMHEADLAREVAEEVASRVEVRVFDAGFRRISTGLVRELVDNELLALGLAGALRRQTSVGVPLHDLRAILASPEAVLDPSRPAAQELLSDHQAEARVASEVLRRYALEELLDEASAQGHLAGDFALLDLNRPELALSGAVPAELLLSGQPSPRVAFECLDELVRAARVTATGVVLENPALVLLPIVRERRAGTSSLGAWLAALTAAARALERRLDLGSPGERAVALTAELVRELAVAPPNPFAPRLFLSEREIELVVEEAPDREADLERLLLARRVVPTWSAPGESFAGPGCVRVGRERGAVLCAAAAALNLPRLAWRAGPWREDRLLEATAELVERALAALTQLAAAQTTLRGQRLGELRARGMVALTPVGLREALQLLGDGEIRPEQGARLLGLIADAAARAAERARLAVCVTPFFGERAAARFAALDARLPEQAQRLLFEQGVGAGLAPGAPYTAGFRIGPVSGLAPWSAEAALLPVLGTGALHPLPEERSRGGELGTLRSLAAFAALRREPFSGARASRAEPAFDIAPAPARRPVPSELFSGEFVAVRPPLETA